MLGKYLFVVIYTYLIQLDPRALKSPQILELSGIGDSRLLRSLDITPIIDLPGVGENMQEHMFCAFTFGELTLRKTREEITYTEMIDQNLIQISPLRPLTHWMMKSTLRRNYYFSAFKRSPQ